MSKIRVMSDALSNLIAAGEVIERPASVVKELAENSVDAGATMVCVRVERAGAKLISVSDNGCGMDADDALLALEPHGTSKLAAPEDMHHITTLGFRGEAIPSIAAVSRFSLRTRPENSLEATEVRVEGGKLLSASPAGGQTGTEICVRDLFFNVPARKKFLKSPATEEHHIEETLIAIALGHCNVGFELHLDGRAAFRTPPGTPENRMRELFGRTFLDNLIPFEHREGEFFLHGFIAAPGFTRPTRKEQRVFINSRPVEAPAVYRGIREGYGALADSSGRFPPALIFLEMPPEELDVNVHPAKREVRFKSEFSITRAVACAVGNALRRRGAVPLTPRREADPSETAETETIETEKVFPEKRPMPLSGQVPLAMILDSARIEYAARRSDQPELPRQSDSASWRTEESRPDPALRLSDRDDTVPPSPSPASVNLAEPEPEPSASVRGWPTEVLGIFDATYILASGPEGLVLIDQHAAHERILFESVLAEWKRGGNASQRQLFAGTLELPRPQMTLFLRHRKIFEALGFDLEPAGGSTVLINAVPARIPDGRAPAEVIGDMLAELVENSTKSLPLEMEYAARAACRAAVKAHDTLDITEAAELLRRLQNCRQGTLCPHGRPTMVSLSRSEIEKRFGRK